MPPRLVTGSDFLDPGCRDPAPKSSACRALPRGIDCNDCDARTRSGAADPRAQVRGHERETALEAEKADDEEWKTTRAPRTVFSSIRVTAPMRRGVEMPRTPRRSQDPLRVTSREGRHRPRNQDACTSFGTLARRQMTPPRGPRSPPVHSADLERSAARGGERLLHAKRDATL